MKIFKHLKYFIIPPVSKNDTLNGVSTRQFSPFSRNARSLQNTHTVQNKTSVDEKEPNEALQVKRGTSEFGDFSSKACFILV